MSTINKDQLMSEQAFIHYCNSEPVGGGRRLNITSEFIKAAKKDGLIKPPLRVSEEVIGEDGPSKQLVEYYSPHQLFIVVGNERLDTVVRAKEVLNRYVTSYPGVLPQVILPF